MMNFLRQIFTFTMLIYCLCFAATFHVNGTHGDDANPGTEASPFATIQKAADTMQAGDVCMIRKGTYHEVLRPAASGNNGAPIQFKAYPGESVYLSGCQTLSKSWEAYQDGIYRIDVSGVGDIMQVFVGQERMKIARTPNNLSDDMMNPTLGGIRGIERVQKPGVSELSDPALAETDADLTGADLWLLTGLKWVAFSSTVEWHDGETLGFVFPGDAESYAYKPMRGSNYFVTGAFDCLDIEREWFYDQEDQMLYFYPPGGVDPSSLDVQVRTREWGIDISNRQYIEIENINLFAAAVNMHESEYCVLDGSGVFYPVPFFQADSWATTETPQNAKYSSIKLGGNDNVVKNCEVAYSWGEGIVIYGEGNTIENCLIHDIDWIATDAAPIHTSGTAHNIVKNTIYRAGRSGLVHRKSTALEIAYNDIYDCGLLTTDLGATYCWQTDGEGTVIHHNWVHDVVTRAHTAGIYLDNGSANFVVHHNVVWNCDDLALQTNLNAYNHEIYNNTFWGCAQAMGGGGGDDILENQVVYNNLSNAATWFGTDVQGNLALDDPGFVDPENGDFRLREDSPARDDYIITTSLSNGDFENGTGGWSGAGAQLESIQDPVHSGEFAVRTYERNQYWEGARQNITEVLKERGPGKYTIEAWVRTAEGTTNGYLRFKISDDNGDDYPGIQRKCNPDEWTKISYTTNLNWTGTLTEAVFELMTSGGTNQLTDLYIDDCQLIAPASSDSSANSGGILIAGITDDVVDNKPDAGAYEYGGTNADWKAGATLAPKKIVLPTAVQSSQTLPTAFELLQNYPNPFNGNTTIDYHVSATERVSVAVYNVLGEHVKTLVDGIQPAGMHNIHWDGRNDAGELMSSGVYLYKLNMHNQKASTIKKMIFVR